MVLKVMILEKMVRELPVNKQLQIYLSDFSLFWIFI